MTNKEHGLQLINRRSGLPGTVVSWDVSTDTVIVKLSSGQEANYSVQQIADLWLIIRPCNFKSQCDSEPIAYREQFCGCYNKSYMKNLHEVHLAFHAASRDLQILSENEVQAGKKALYIQAFAESRNVINKIIKIIDYEANQEAGYTYEKELRDYNEFWEAKKPNIEHYDDPVKFKAATSEWLRLYHLDKPAPPKHIKSN